MTTEQLASVKTALASFVEEWIPASVVGTRRAAILAAFNALKNRRVSNTALAGAVALLPARSRNSPVKAVLAIKSAIASCATNEETRAAWSALTNAPTVAAQQQQQAPRPTGGKGRRQATTTDAAGAAGVKKAKRTTPRGGAGVAPDDDDRDNSDADDDESEADDTEVDDDDAAPAPSFADVFKGIPSFEKSLAMRFIVQSAACQPRLGAFTDKDMKDDKLLARRIAAWYDGPGMTPQETAAVTSAIARAKRQNAPVTEEPALIIDDAGDTHTGTRVPVSDSFPCVSTLQVHRLAGAERHGLPSSAKSSFSTLQAFEAAANSFKALQHTAPDLADLSVATFLPTAGIRLPAHSEGTLSDFAVSYGFRLPDLPVLQTPLIQQCFFRQPVTLTAQALDMPAIACSSAFLLRESRWWDAGAFLFVKGFGATAMYRYCVFSSLHPFKVSGEGNARTVMIDPGRCGFSSLTDSLHCEALLAAHQEKLVHRLAHEEKDRYADHPDSLPVRWFEHLRSGVRAAARGLEAAEVRKGIVFTFMMSLFVCTGAIPTTNPRVVDTLRPLYDNFLRVFDIVSGAALTSGALDKLPGRRLESSTPAAATWPPKSQHERVASESGNVRHAHQRGSSAPQSPFSAPLTAAEVAKLKADPPHWETNPGPLKAHACWYHNVHHTDLTRDAGCPMLRLWRRAFPTVRLHFKIGLVITVPPNALVHLLPVLAH
jgi:hypothetical protein